MRRNQMFRRHRIGDPGCRECKKATGEYPEAHGDGGLIHQRMDNVEDARGRSRRQVIRWCDECGRTNGL